MPKITAAIEAKATPDIVESGGVELRGRGQLLDVTDIYKKLEKAHGGWVGTVAQDHAGARRAGPSHPLRLPGLHAGRPRRPREGGRPHAAAGDVGRPARPTPRRPRSCRGSFGLGIPVSNQTDSQVWEDIMKSYGARLADDKGKRIILGDYKKEVWEFLDFFTEVWKAGVLPPGRDDLGQHDEQLHLPVRQGRVHPESDHALAVARGEQPRAPGQDRALHVPARAQGTDPAASRSARARS